MQRTLCALIISLLGCTSPDDTATPDGGPGADVGVSPDAPGRDAPGFDAPGFDAPGFDAPGFDVGPNGDAGGFDAAPTDTGIPTGGTQYYIATGGNDSSSCSESEPCLTFERAASVLSAGDALIIEDGRYTQATHGALSSFTEEGEPLPRAGFIPSGAGADSPTVIRARNPGRVHIEGGLTVGNRSRKVQYVTIYGLTFHQGGAIQNGDFIQVKECGFEGGFGIGTIDHSEGNTYNLVEDVWIWGAEFRAHAVNYRAHHNTWRRVIIRGDGCSRAWCGEREGNGSAGITVYNSHDNVLENVLVIDRILGANRVGAYADFSTAQHESSQPPQPEGEALGRNSWLGCMSIGSEDTALVFEADAVTDGLTATIHDFTVLASSAGLYLDPAHRPYDGNSIFDVRDVNSFTLEGDEMRVGCDVVQSGDPGCAHSVENVDEGTYAGGQSALLPQTRVGSDEALWPWAHEARIKAEMCDGISRGFCGIDGTITDYVRSF